MQDQNQHSEFYTSSQQVKSLRTSQRNPVFEFKHNISLRRWDLHAKIWEFKEIEVTILIEELKDDTWVRIESYDRRFANFKSTNDYGNSEYQETGFIEIPYQNRHETIRLSLSRALDKTRGEYFPLSRFPVPVIFKKSTQYTNPQGDTIKRLAWLVQDKKEYPNQLIEVDQLSYYDKHPDEKPDVMGTPGCVVLIIITIVLVLLRACGVY